MPYYSHDPTSLHPYTTDIPHSGASTLISVTACLTNSGTKDEKFLMLEKILEK